MSAKGDKSAPAVTENAEDDGAHHDGEETGLRLRKKPTMTEAGKANLINALKRQIKSVSKRLDKQITVLTPLLQSTNVNTINSETLNLDRIYNEITQAHARLCETLDSDEDREEYDAAVLVLDTIDKHYFDVKAQLGKWQLDWDAQMSKNGDGSRSSHSSRASSKGSGRSGKSNKSMSSTSSKKSNASNKSLKLRAKIAGLRAETEAIKKTNEAELNVLLLKKEQEIAKMEAMEKVYSDSCYDQKAEKTAPFDDAETLDQIKVKSDVDNRTVFKRLMEQPKEEMSVEKTKEDEPPQKRAKPTPDLQDAVVEMMRIQAAPKPHLDIFTGDPLEYPYFRACFVEVVETVVADQRGRLTRLIKFTGGDAKDLIKHLVHADQVDCYDKAIQMLDKEYGNPHLIHQSYVKELRQWGPIPANDPSAYKKFYRFLLKCHTYKDTYQIRELDSTEMIRSIICKVHHSLQERWNRKAANIRNNQSREADFSDLIAFIDYEVTLMSDPAYSKEALANANAAVKSNFTSTVSPAVTVCHICSSNHDIESCNEFLNMNIDDRHRTIFQKKLCFGCYDPVSQDHNGKSCQKKRKCLVCKEDHPTTLHGGKSVSAFSSSMQRSVISMCVVQVELWHDDSPNNVVKTYALLDECSTGSFITEEVLDMLAVPNTEFTSVDVTTLNGSHQLPARRVEKSKLNVRATSSHFSNYKDDPIKLPVTYSRPFLAVDPEEIPTPSKICHWEHLKGLVNKIPDYNPAVPIGLMLGGDCPKANEVVEVIPSANNGPYGKRTRLGWCIIGPIAGCSPSKSIHTNYTNLRGKIPVKDVTTGNVSHLSFFQQEDPSGDPYVNMLNHMYRQDFNDANGEKEGLSVEDRRFLQIMKEGVVKVDGHYQLPLPFRNDQINLPNNRVQANNRLSSLKRRMLADPDFFAAYNTTIQDMLLSGYARKANPRQGEQGEVWYVPHFGVSNAKKGKLRVVFDFSAKFKGRCLNNELIPGPNLANLMIGVILRFRKENIAYMADIEAMYHQVLVPEEQRSFLRFLFWPDGDLEAAPIDLEMCVHPFGAVSSGSCANYALLQTADDNEKEYGSEAANTLRREFYIDDNLKSLESVPKALDSFVATQNMCRAGGFKLTKFASNSAELTAAIPSDCHAPSLFDLSMSKQSLPVERALGVFWCMENDNLQFRIVLQDKPLTRRGVLSTIGSVYDPIGVAGPFLLRGRKVLQAITKLKGDWDDDLPPSLRAEWEKWRTEIPRLEKIKINRCYKPLGFNSATASLHSFSDASEYGYGMVTYLRQVSTEGEVSVSLVMAKSRVVPSMKPSIPRLELIAADTSAKTTALVNDELDMPLKSISYWVDSMIVLGYIQNETKRARTFVANRVQTILSLTKKDSWNHIDTKQNPADYASRGLEVGETEKVDMWLNGPQMLWEKEDPSLKPLLEVQIPDDDPEINLTATKITCNATSLSDTTVLGFLENLDSWMEMKEVVATAAVFLKLIHKQRENTDLNTSDITAAENKIIKMIQNKHYSGERKRLEAGLKILKSSPIIRLDPFLDEEQILRVGGRLRKGKLLDCEKHPIILPKKEPIILAIVQHFHEEIAHLGRTSTLGELRSRGFWVINGGAVVRKLVYHCQHCKELRGKPESQKMADLPEERVLSAEPPFTRCGADMFGPFVVKEGRKELKRYCILFTCYSCRGVHIETTKSMDTDSFILGLRRFLSRRGPVKSIRSDNGGNFVGVEEEMKKAILELDHDRIRAELLKHECDWIEWQKNPPEASHMGGVWERQIRTVRNVLSSLLKEHSGRLDDEALQTLLCESEAIVNSRPLTVDNLGDENESPLTPNHLLTMKTKVLLPPPGVFQRADVYCRKRWRAVQHLANVFWSRFRKEYLQASQPRQKWNSARRNVAVGDIVLVVEKELPRNRWLKGRVVQVFPGDDGLVRHVDVKIAGSGSTLKRPITKLVVLIRADDP